MSTISSPPVYTLRAIAKMSRAPASTILRWVKEGILPPVRFRGRNTTYGPEHARIARAIRIIGFQATKHPRFKEMIPLILNEPHARVVTDAPKPPEPQKIREPRPELMTPQQVANARVWARTPLLPGLELHAALPIAPIIETLRDEIRTRYGAREDD